MMNELDWNVVTINSLLSHRWIYIQTAFCRGVSHHSFPFELMRWCASRKKKTERTEQTADVGLNFEEEDLVTNIDEDSEDEGEK